MILLSTARGKKASSNFHKFRKSEIFFKKRKAEAVARPLFSLAKKACVKINKIDNVFKRGLIEKER